MRDFWVQQAGVVLMTCVSFCSGHVQWREEWVRLSSRISTDRALHQKSKRPTGKADGPDAFFFLRQWSTRPEAQRQRSEHLLEPFSTDLRKHSRTQDVAVCSSLSKACLAACRNRGFVQRGFFLPFSSIIEFFFLVPSTAGRRACTRQQWPSVPRKVTQQGSFWPS